MIYLLLILSFFPAQENKCTLTIQEAPTVRGFKLGMPLEEVRKVSTLWGFGVANEIGVKEFEVSPAVHFKDIRAAKGIDSIKLEFLDDRLVYFEIKYDKSITWEGIDHFTSKLSELLSLPLAWQAPVVSKSTILGVQFAVSAKKLECKGFNVGAVVPSTGGAELLLGETGLREIKEKRREALKQRKLETFTP